jgi:hypothetical protein
MSLNNRETHQWICESITFPLYNIINRVAQRYSAGLRVGWSGVRVPGGAGNFSPHHSVKTSSEVQLVPYTMSTRVSFPWGKAAGS